MAGERTGRLADTDPESVPYFAVTVLPSRVGAAPVAGAGARDDEGPRSEVSQAVEAAGETRHGGSADAPARGEVVVIGTGPAGPMWLTPEARGELAAAEDLVGYTTYLDRVPVRPGQRRHPSDNKVESERADFALDLARRGHRVAVVSSGDPGVFAMATAVLEVASSAAVQGRAGTDRAGRDGGERGGLPRGRPARPRLRGRSRCPTGSSRGTWSRPACTRRPRRTWRWPCTTRARSRRTWQVGKARELLLEHRAPGHPGGARAGRGRPAGSGSGSCGSPTWTRREVDMRTILLVGSSQTVAVRAGRRRDRLDAAALPAGMRGARSARGRQGTGRSPAGTTRRGDRPGSLAGSGSEPARACGNRGPRRWRHLQHRRIDARVRRSAFGVRRSAFGVRRRRRTSRTALGVGDVPAPRLPARVRARPNGPRTPERCGPGALAARPGPHPSHTPHIPGPAAVGRAGAPHGVRGQLLPPPPLMPPS